MNYFPLIFMLVVAVLPVAIGMTVRFIERSWEAPHFGRASLVALAYGSALVVLVNWETITTVLGGGQSSRGDLLLSTVASVPAFLLGFFLLLGGYTMAGQVPARFRKR